MGKSIFASFGAMGVCLSAVSASASIVTFELNINGSSTSPAPVRVGDTVTIAIYSRVTQNQYDVGGTPMDLGLSLYAINLDGGNYLKPDAASVLTPTKWKATDYAHLGFFDKGTISGNKVLSVGGSSGAPDGDNAMIGVDRTMLASGTFKAIAAGTITLGGEIYTNPNVYAFADGNLKYAAADTVNWSPIPSLVVMPVPEPSVMMLGAGVVLGSLNVRSRRRAAT